MFFHICLRYDRLFTVGKIETWPFQISQSPRFPLEKFHGRNDLGHHKVQVMRYPTRNWRLKDEPEMPETKFKFLEVPNHNQVWFQYVSMFHCHIPEFLAGQPRHSRLGP